MTHSLQFVFSLNITGGCTLIGLGWGRSLSWSLLCQQCNNLALMEELFECYSKLISHHKGYTTGSCKTCDVHRQMSGVSAFTIPTIIHRKIEYIPGAQKKSETHVLS